MQCQGVSCGSSKVNPLPGYKTQLAVFDLAFQLGLGYDSFWQFTFASVRIKQTQDIIHFFRIKPQADARSHQLPERSTVNPL